MSKRKRRRRKPLAYSAWTGGMKSRALSWAGKWKGKPPLQLEATKNWVSRGRSSN